MERFHSSSSPACTITDSAEPLVAPLRRVSQSSAGDSPDSGLSRASSTQSAWSASCSATWPQCACASCRAAQSIGRSATRCPTLRQCLLSAESARLAERESLYATNTRTSRIAGCCAGAFLAMAHASNPRDGRIVGKNPRLRARPPRAKALTLSEGSHPLCSLLAAGLHWGDCPLRADALRC